MKRALALCVLAALFAFAVCAFGCNNDAENDVLSRFSRDANGIETTEHVEFLGAEVVRFDSWDGLCVYYNIKADDKRDLTFCPIGDITATINGNACLNVNETAYQWQGGSSALGRYAGSRLWLGYIIGAGEGLPAESSDVEHCYSVFKIPPGCLAPDSECEITIICKPHDEVIRFPSSAISEKYEPKNYGTG